MTLRAIFAVSVIITSVMPYVMVPPSPDSLLESLGNIETNDVRRLSWDIQDGVSYKVTLEAHTGELALSLFSDDVDNCQPCNRSETNAKVVRHVTASSDGTLDIELLGMTGPAEYRLSIEPLPE
ncbi:MAG: hypothetical protein HN348_30225 [Proteobacteria bacterium]|nr:hypothetical protein [Pseudomonadota bacterium]